MITVLKHIECVVIPTYCLLSCYSELVVHTHHTENAEYQPVYIGKQESGFVMLKTDQQEGVGGWPPRKVELGGLHCLH